MLVEIFFQATSLSLMMEEVQIIDPAFDLQIV